MSGYPPGALATAVGEGARQMTPGDGVCLWLPGDWLPTDLMSTGHLPHDQQQPRVLLSLLLFHSCNKCFVSDDSVHVSGGWQSVKRRVRESCLFGSLQSRAAAVSRIHRTWKVLPSVRSCRLPPGSLLRGPAPWGLPWGGPDFQGEAQHPAARQLLRVSSQQWWPATGGQSQRNSKQNLANKISPK